jgi:hypothetical protein
MNGRRIRYSMTSIVLVFSLLLSVQPVQAGWFRRSIEADIARTLEGTVVRSAERRALTALEIRERDALARSALRDVELKTGHRISAQQRGHLIEAYRQRDFRELSAEQKAVHDLQYKNFRQRMMADWEHRTGQQWPTYNQSVLTRSGQIYKNVGESHDLHHIIPRQNGGPNIWWNSHPAASPVEHQASIHAAGSPLARLLNWLKGT